jgi:hypothetical protein
MQKFKTINKKDRRYIPLFVTVTSTLFGNGMEDDRDQQKWRIHLTAKAKRFNFRFRFKAATNQSTQTISFFRFSILLNLPHFLFTITSHPKKRSPLSFINFKFKKFFLKFRPRKKPNIAAKTKISSNVSSPIQFKDRVKIGKSYCERISMMVFFFASYLLKKLKMVKFMKFPAFLLVGAVTVVYYLFYYFNYWEFIGRSIWNK